MHERIILVVFSLLLPFGHCQGRCLGFTHLLEAASNPFSEGSQCQTPEGTSGSCISIKSCEPLVQLLRTRSNDPDTRNFLRRSVCGYTGSTPLVCCPETRSPVATTEEARANTSPIIQKGSTGSSSLPEPPICGYGNKTVGRVVGGIPAKLGMLFLADLLHNKSAVCWDHNR